MPDLLVGSKSGQPVTTPAHHDVLDDASLLRRVFAIALSAGGQWVELFRERRFDGAATVGDQQRSLSRSSTQGVSLRVMGHGGRSCQVHTPLDDPRSLRDLAQQARAAFAVVAQTTVRPLVERVASGTSLTPCLDPLADYVDIARLVQRADDALTAARAHGAQSVQVRATTWARELTIRSSDGLRLALPEQGTRIAVDAFVDRSGKRSKGRASWSAAGSTEQLPFEDATAIGMKAATQAIRLTRASVPATADLAVVLSPPAAGLLVHELMGHACEADAVESGASLIAGRMGQQVTDSAVWLCDGHPGGQVWGAATHDDEGTPNRAHPMITAGRFVGALTDRRYAGRSAHPTSGNGRRQSYAHRVLPRVSHTEMAVGDTAQAEMVAGIPHGLLALSMEGGAINSRTGVLNLAVKEALMIRSGQPAERVRGATLTGDALDILTHIQAVGDDPVLTPMLCGKQGQWIPVSATSPSVLVERMRAVGG
jgi:TldD protein